MPRPPTKAMLAVLRRMATGCRFWRAEGLDVRHWIFEAAASEMQNVNAKTAHGLADRGLVIWARGFPTSKASLTAEGWHLALSCSALLRPVSTEPVYFCPSCGELEDFALVDFEPGAFDTAEEFEAVNGKPFGCNSCVYKADVTTPSGYGLPDMVALLAGAESGSSWQEVDLGMVVRLAAKVIAGKEPS